MKNNYWDIGDIRVTKRELLVSVTIIAIMLLLGFVIAGKIEASQVDKNAEYYKAAQITDSEIFRYGMNTSIGNAFAYGTLEPVDTVTFSEIGGQYMYVEKVEEHYNRHTRTVRSGKITTVKTYYTWDFAGREEVYSQKIRFCGVEMDYSKIQQLDTDYIDTINQSNHVRFKYYGCKGPYTGTIYTDLRDGTMSDNSPFYENQEISQVVEHLTSGHEIIIFWIVWLIVTGIAVFGFCYFKKDWLEG